MDSYVCVESAPLACTGAAGSGPTKREAWIQRTALRDGSVPVARHREIPGASHTSKIIVKPCAGKPHARFERGFHGTRPAAIVGTAP